MGQYRHGKRMKAYVAGSNKILVQLTMMDQKRILVFDQNGYIMCDDDLGEGGRELVADAEDKDTFGGSRIFFEKLRVLRLQGAQI